MDWDVRELETVESTQDVLRELLSSNPALAQGTVIHGGEQLRGRGRHGRVWHSPPGNLYLSVLLRPEKALPDSVQLSFVAALAVFETVQTFTPPEKDVRLKWPNDVLVDGQKCAGILLEVEQDKNHSPCILIGMGVNVAAAPEGAFSLGEAVKTLRGLRTVLLNNLDATYELWLSEGFSPIRARWWAHGWKRYEDISVTLGDQTVIGKFTGLDETGTLLLQLPDGGIKSVQAGEVLL